MNPRKVVPIIDDNGFVLSESRAIMTYLINQYSPGHRLYPANAKKRAEVDRLLYLTAEMWERFKPIIRTPMRRKEWPPSEVDKDSYYGLLKALQLLTAGKEFLAGDEMTIADISFICDLTVLTDVLGFPIDHVTPSLAVWSQRMKTELPEYDELITKPVIKFRGSIEEMLGRKLD